MYTAPGHGNCRSEQSLELAQRQNGRSATIAAMAPAIVASPTMIAQARRHVQNLESSGSSPLDVAIAVPPGPAGDMGRSGLVGIPQPGHRILLMAAVRKVTRGSPASRPGPPVAVPTFIDPLGLADYLGAVLNVIPARRAVSGPGHPGHARRVRRAAHEATAWWFATHSRPFSDMYRRSPSRVTYPCLIHEPIARGLKP